MGTSLLRFLQLPPTDIYKIWQLIAPLDFKSTHGAFNGMDIRDSDMDEQAQKTGKTTKWKMVESMRIQVQSMGHDVDMEMLSDGF